jgi:uncharacterized protein (DUF2141 family)
MNKIICIAMVLLLIPNNAISQLNLEIEISGIRNNEGKIMLQLFDENQNILAREMSIIKDNKCNISLKNLKPGRYAVRYYHDENLDGKMETNMVGKPIEGYGFSNNVTGKFGPPPFEKWLFELKENKKIVLNPAY